MMHHLLLCLLTAYFVVEQDFDNEMSHDICPASHDSFATSGMTQFRVLLARHIVTILRDTVR